jgi:hypothetical protein
MRSRLEGPFANVSIAAHAEYALSFMGHVGGHNGAFQSDSFKKSTGMDFEGGNGGTRFPIPRPYCTVLSSGGDQKTSSELYRLDTSTTTTSIEVVAPFETFGIILIARCEDHVVDCNIANASEVTKGNAETR